jgi:mercuric ion transport protein
MKLIELVYFDGCPHADLARQRVQEALRSAGLSARLREWERSDPSAPAHVRYYASPTVLVDGRDVTGVGPGADTVACHAEGAPSVDAIRRVLTGVSTKPAATRQV